MEALRPEAGWERLFWLVFRQSANPIVLLSEHRRIVEANGAGLELLKRRREDVLGTSIVETIHPSDRPQAAREWAGFLRSGQYSGTRALLRADGSDVKIDFAARLETVGERRLAIYVAMPHEAGVAASPSSSGTRLPLTRREREVVTMIALGHETPRIAEELHIAPDTVRTHVRNAMTKLGARTRAQLVAIVLCSEQAIQMPGAVH
jgi:PAS domain S-box-containing protein